jgi:hypothetical protein
MKPAEVFKHLDRAEASLKDFQRSTVDVVCNGLYRDGLRSMLIADEVGLGKTVVAKGVIARTIRERIQGGVSGPLKVTYICSNQVIGRENIRKLQLFPDADSDAESISRISSLGLNVSKGSCKGAGKYLRLSTLTPATSFQVSNSTGIAQERALIYRLLTEDRKLNAESRGLRWLLIAGVGSIDRFKQIIDWVPPEQVRKGLAKKFLKGIKRITLNPDLCKAVGIRRGGKLYRAVRVMAEKLQGKNHQNTCHELTLLLRKQLIDCCLDYVDADLFILDEFQRFEDLISDDPENEQAMIAARIFRHPKSRILLLSATPFKAFTTRADNDRGDDHYKEFKKVLGFLLKDKPGALDEYEIHRNKLFGQLVQLKNGATTLDPEPRDRIQEILRSRICRTERTIAGAAVNSLISDNWKTDTMSFDAGDIVNFTLTDAIAAELEKLEPGHHGAVEFCKSALFPLSFMEHYQFKAKLLKHRKTEGVAEALARSKSAWVDTKAIDSYRWSIFGKRNPGDPAHSPLRYLAEKAIGEQGCRMLWVPPSLPYYPLKGAFKKAEGFTKTLVFSSWVMVPRMISTLLSYEVEKRTIGDKASIRGKEKGSRRYFQEHRNPRPLITFRTRSRGGEVANMSNFTLIYPSLALARLVDPVDWLGKDKTLSEVIREVTGRIRQKLAESGIREFAGTGDGSERWYWAAPILLDRDDPQAQLWMDEDSSVWSRETFFSKTDEAASGKERHAEEMFRCFNDPQSAGLGPVPMMLPRVLAEISLGSPAIVTYRTLARLFPDEAPAALMVHAFEIGKRFIELFNKPESIAAVRLSEEPAAYWRAVIRYCASGCLQSVLDEYCHLLKGQNLSLPAMVEQLVQSINLTSAPLNVDSLDTFLGDESPNEPKKMRCHYATVFGNQHFDRESGQNRAVSVREVFNSPFRPFVLSSTSIGQEGLDFHSYCRRIVHWNLPGNPVDLEQREGRINRYKGLVIRQNLAQRYREQLAVNIPAGAVDIWERLFELAEQEKDASGDCDLVPFWHVNSDRVKIERVIPQFPFSRDRQRLDMILRTLTIYRLAFGQPRQAELVDHLINREFTPAELEDIRRNLMIDLCPIGYEANIRA